MKSFEFKRSAIFPEDANPGEVVAVVNQNSMNVILSVMTSSSRAAGMHYSHVDLGNAALDVSRQLGTGLIHLTFLTEDVASHTDANTRLLIAWIQKACSSLAQTFFFPCVTMAQMKAIVGGVSKVIQVSKICGGVPKVIIEDDKDAAEEKGG